MPISRSQMPRQMYGLGSLVKSIGKTVKKIVKSPIGKAAILGFGANALMPGGLSSLFSGGGGLTGILSKGKDLIGGLTGAQKITGALALGGAFAGMEDQQVEELKRNPEALRSYLAQYYRNLNQGAKEDEVNRFVEANMTEYKADGGRIGYAEGMEDPTYTGNNMEDLPRGLQMDTTTSNPIPEDADRQSAAEIAKVMMGVRSLPREEGEIEDTETMSTEDFMTEQYLMPKVNELVENYGISRLEALKMVRDEMAKFVRPAKAYGGRMGYQNGSPEENAVQASGIMDLPLNKNPAGITELDLRETGGFIPPVGVKEKADDIPAMLSNNEFVFTADAVRGMGDGNVNKGAQRMYDMMKKLEKGGRV
jgi:hypothetical protein